MVGTLTAAILHLKATEAGPDEPDEIGLQIHGETCRLEIPLTSVYNLRRVAALLRGLAEQLDFLSRRDDIPPRSITFQARESARATNYKLRAMRRKKGV